MSNCVHRHLLLALLAAAASGFGPTATAAPGPDFNALILAETRAMPSGGGYDTTPATTAKLGGAIDLTPGDRLVLTPERAVPSYCSGATYFVFLRVVESLRISARISLPRGSIDALVPRDRPTRPDRKPNEWGPRDGEGVWGRWNANGPGTARLFHELRLGRSFPDFASARPGDFLKIWWNEKIGARERGHSVIYLGTSVANGVEMVRFWSSNQGLGYGTKEVPRSDIKRALFSRLEHPDRLARADALPPTDAYLYDLQTRDSTPAEMRARCGY